MPTSAHSGDGMGNLVGLLVQLSENFLAQRLAFAEDLQVKPLEMVGKWCKYDVARVN